MGGGRAQKVLSGAWQRGTSEGLGRGVGNRLSKCQWHRVYTCVDPPIFQKPLVFRGVAPFPAGTAKFAQLTFLGPEREKCDQGLGLGIMGGVRQFLRRRAFT